MKVKLKKPHEHAGRKHGAGEQITVTAAQKAWLQARGIVAGDDQPAKKEPK